MTAAGAGAAAGVSWIDVAASAAGIYNQMAAVGQQAAAGFSQAFNSEWGTRATSAMKFGGNVVGDFASLGTEAANTFVGQFTRVLQGGVPDPKAFFDLFEHGVDDMVNDVVAKVPLIGPAFQKAFSVVQPLVDSFIGITGEMGEAVEELGAQWMEMARTFAENTVDAEGLARLMTVTQQIAESGAVVSLQDVSESIGLINQRIQGLNNDQLRELTTTVALADEVFHGAGPNVNYLTQALNAFDVAAGDANETTIELVNASRASGQPLNQMLMAMIQLGPAFREMGYDAEQSAMFLGDMTKSGEPLARIAFAFNDVVTSFQKHGITDTHAAWTELINTMRTDVLEGHDELASQLAAKYTITPRAITMLIDAMKKGEPLLPEELTAAQPLGNLHTSIEEIIEKTRTLRDAWMQISNILQGVLAPLGVGLESGLITMTDHVRNWLEENKQQIIGWAGNIGHWVLTGIGDLTGALSSTIKALEPIMNALFKVVLTGLTGVADMIHMMLQLATHLPFIGHDFVDAANASGDIAAKLGEISKFDFAGNTEKFADMLSHISNDSIPEMDRKLRGFIDHQKASLAIQDAITTNFAAPGQTAPTPQPIFSPEIEHGLETLTKDPKAIQDVIDKLADLGIHMQVDPEGRVTQFTTRTEHEADELRKYLEATFGEEAWKELSPKLNITVNEHPLMTPEEARRKVGLPDEIDVPVRPVTPDNLPGILGVPGQPVPPGSVAAPGGTAPPIEIMPGVPLPGHPSGYVEIPGQVTIKPAAFPSDMRQVLDSAGVPEGAKSADGVVIPAGLAVTTPTNLTPENLMDRAGVPFKYQGDVQNASPGIVLPAGLDVKDAPDQKSVADVMEAVGIPYKNQGQDGVVLDVSFNMPSGGGGFGAPGGVQNAAGGDLWNQFQQKFQGQFPDAPPGGAPGGASPSQSQAASTIINEAKARGFSPEQIMAVLSTGLQESGLDEAARGGGGAWHGIFQQDTSYPGRDQASTNIKAFFDRLGAPGSDIWGQIFGLQQGTPYNSPGARRAYLTEIQSKLQQAQQLYAQLANQPAVMTAQTGGVIQPHHLDPTILAAIGSSVTHLLTIHGLMNTGQGSWPDFLAGGGHQSGGAVGYDPGPPGGDWGIHLGDVKKLWSLIGRAGATKPWAEQLFGEWAGSRLNSIGRQQGGLAEGPWWGPGAPPVIDPGNPIQPGDYHTFQDYLHAINLSHFLGSILAARRRGGGPVGLQSGGEVGGHDWEPFDPLLPGTPSHHEDPYGEFDPIGTPTIPAGAPVEMPPQYRDLVTGGIKYQAQKALVKGAMGAISAEIGIGSKQFGHQIHEGAKKIGLGGVWDFLGGRPFQSGGHVEGQWWPGRDSVPMDLPVGTFVVNRDMSHRHRGLLDELMSSGAGGGTGRRVPTLLEVGERLVPPGIAMRNLGLMHAINSGMLSRQGGGSVAEAEAWAQFASGQPYNADSYLDCSGYVSSVWGVMTGVGAGRHFDTTYDFAGHGWQPGYRPGMFNIAVNPLPGMSGHMIAQLPNGTVIESGGSDNMIKYGSGTSMNSPQFSEHFWWPVGGGQNPALGVSDATFTFPTGGGGGGGGGGGANVSMADYTGGDPGGGGGPGGTGGLPPPPVPNRPTVGGYYGVQDPKTAMQALGTGGLPPGTDLSKLPPFTPGQPPFNPYTNPPPWPMTQKDQQDFKRSFDQWLISMGDLGDSLQNAQDQQTRANDQKQKADDALTKAQTDLGDFLKEQHLASDKDYDESDPNSKISQLRRKAADALTRQQEAADAQTRAGRGITSAQQREYISGETPPPEAPGMKDALKGQQITPDEKAAQLGAGLVKGVFQELGFPDVFGKAFTNWGVWKLGMGGLGYGMGLLDAMANPQGQGGGGGGQPSGLFGLFSGLSQGLGSSPFKPQQPGSPQTNLFGGPTGQPPGPGALYSPENTNPALSPGGAPPPASDTAGVPQSQTPVNQPPGAAPASYGGGLTVNYNPQGLNVLSQPQVTAGITDALHQTGAPQISGGQGLP